MATATPPPLSAGLVITEPADGARLREQGLVVRGLAPPFVTVTQDIPFWFDQHTQADALGRWSMAVRLTPGENVITFRIDRDQATARTITVQYFPD